jgi:hypothetical protein
MSLTCNKPVSDVRDLTEGLHRDSRHMMRDIFPTSHPGLCASNNTSYWAHRPEDVDGSRIGPQAPKVAVLSIIINFVSNDILPV